MEHLPKGSENLDLDDTDEYEGDDIKNAIKLQISSNIRMGSSVNNRILIEAQQNMRARDHHDHWYMDSAPKYGTSLDLAEGEEYVKIKTYKDDDINGYLATFNK